MSNWQDIKKKLPTGRVIVEGNRVDVKCELVDIYDSEEGRSYTVRANIQPLDKTMARDEIEIICNTIRKTIKPIKE